METDTLEGGGTFIKLLEDEAAVVWTTDGVEIVMPPMKKIPEPLALFMFTFARLTSDEDFAREMSKLMRKMARL